MNLESELNVALQRVDPPEGFAERVMESVRDGSRRPAEAVRHTMRRALAAAALIAAMLGGWGVHETLRARNELLTAMRIASHTVAQAQKQVNRR
ncbi:MAG TPA: hypothetical protein VL284_20565 [Thermoanaerobaculia bacterium]|nr:hypothetical protein [Thermoanaerobaculia bacterium]